MKCKTRAARKRYDKQSTNIKIVKKPKNMPATRIYTTYSVYICEQSSEKFTKVRKYFYE